MKATATYLLALSAFVVPAHAGSQITVVHGALAAPTYIDLGDPGESVGDQRLWHYDGQDDKNDKVTMDWVMTTTTTTTTNKPETFESRTTLGIFTFSSGPQDRILLQGVGLYPPTGSTLKAHTTLERAIIGGTGKYSGATGNVVTTHLEDGSWKHVFRMD